MKFIIVPGWLSKPPHHWYAWVAGELKTRGHEVAILDMPNPAHPNLKSWLAVLLPYLDDPADTVLIGHSLGTFTILAAINHLRHQKKFPLVILVSGFGRNILGLSAISRGFKRHRLNLHAIRRKAKHFVVFTSDCDPFVSPLESIWLAYKLKADLKLIPGAGHYTHFLGWKTFPQLLQTLDRFQAP